MDPPASPRNGEANGASSQGKEKARKHSFDPSNINILVVDDDKVMLSIMDRLLKRAGYETLVCASSAREGFDLLQKSREQQDPFHLIVCDVHMPDMDGVQFLSRLRESPEFKEIPVIMMSASEDLDIIYRCIRSGADDYLLKPVRMEMVKTLWQNVWRKRRENEMMKQLTLEESKRHSMQREIDTLKERVTEAVETPVTIIMKTIKDIISANNVTPEVHKALSNILTQLSTSNLYRPVISHALTQEDMENVAKVWFTPGMDSPTLDTRRKTITEMPALNSLRVDPSLTEQLQSWSFNVWEYSLEELRRFVGEMFRHFGLLERFQVPESTFDAFLAEVQRQYHLSNPYHNFRHAVDVLHAVYLTLSPGGVSKYFSSLEMFALMVAAIGHDLDHPGVNNAFEIYTSSTRAMTYHDKSVLENHHLACLMNTLAKPGCDVTAALSPSDKREFRKVVINCIINTDLALQMDILGRINAIAQFNMEQKEHRMLCLIMVLKCADISNTCRPFAIAKHWAELVQEEFFFQGDKEKELKMEVTPYMDRANPQPLAKMQIGFVNAIAVDIFEVLAKLFPSLRCCRDAIATNMKIWTSLLQEAQA